MLTMRGAAVIMRASLYQFHDIAHSFPRGAERNPVWGRHDSRPVTIRDMIRRFEALEQPCAAGPSEGRAVIRYAMVIEKARGNCSPWGEGRVRGRG